MVFFFCVEITHCCSRKDSIPNEALSSFHPNDRCRGLRDQFDMAFCCLGVAWHWENEIVFNDLDQVWNSIVGKLFCENHFLIRLILPVNYFSEIGGIAVDFGNTENMYPTCLQFLSPTFEDLTPGQLLMDFIASWNHGFQEIMAHFQCAMLQMHCAQWRTAS